LCFHFDLLHQWGHSEHPLLGNFESGGSTMNLTNRRPRPNAADGVFGGDRFAGI
jgi:hypothetical protein